MRQLVGVKEVAAFLNVREGWVYKHKEIPHFKIGKYLRFDLDEVKAWAHRNGWGMGRNIA